MIPEKRGTVLLVDDDPAFRADTKASLEDNGFEVMSLESGAHTLRYIQNKEWSWYPWLVITDIVMDGMGGYQLIRRIAELYPNRSIPVIVVSKLYTAEDINEAELAGANAYLRKPFSPEKLLDMIQKVTVKDRQGGISLVFE